MKANTKSNPKAAQITKSAAKSDTTKVVQPVGNGGRITNLYYALSALTEVAALHKRAGVATSTVVVLLFHAIVKMVNENSVRNTAVGKALSTMVLIHSSILASYQYSNGFATIKALPTKKGAVIPTYYSLITGELVNHSATGKSWVEKGLPSEHATVARELRRIVKMCGGDMTVLLNAFNDVPKSVTEVVNQIAQNPKKAGELIIQHSAVGGVLYNYRAMAILKQATAKETEESSDVPTVAVVQYTPWITELADSLLSLSKSNSNLYRKVQATIKRDLAILVK